MREARALVVFYSRSGNSGAVATEIAERLGGVELEQIRDQVRRDGRLGYVRSFLDGMLKRTTTLAPRGRDVRGYDLVIVGGPIWVGEPSSPVRSWLLAHAGELRSVAFFLTHGGSARDEVLAAMARLANRVPVAVVSVRRDEIGTPEASSRIADFAAEAGRAVAAVATKLPAPERTDVG